MFIGGECVQSIACYNHRKIFTKKLKYKMSIHDCIICARGIKTELQAIPNKHGSFIASVVREMEGGLEREVTSEQFKCNREDCQRLLYSYYE